LGKLLNVEQSPSGIVKSGIIDVKTVLQTVKDLLPRLVEFFIGKYALWRVAERRRDRTDERT
jgi:hypothetical protein